MRRLVLDIDSAGHSAVRLKADGEPATKAVQASVIGRRLAPRRTIPVNPPAYDPLANGANERTVQEVNQTLRKLKLQLEQRIKVTIPSAHPVMDWALEHAAFLITRMLVRADGGGPPRDGRWTMPSQGLCWCRVRPPRGARSGASRSVPVSVRVPNSR